MMDAVEPKAGVSGRLTKTLFAVAFVVGLVLFVFIVASYIVVGHGGKYIYSEQTVPNSSSMVGIVFGGGIYNNKPLPLLQYRLDAGAKLLADGKVRKLIVSGDNRFAGYNEPDAMKRYLVEKKGVDPELIQADYAGRSTYETCERAVRVFGLSQALLISDKTHLPRAIYTCRSFGLEAYGYPSIVQADSGVLGQRFREVLARAKAIINIYFIGERTILGETITV